MSIHEETNTELTRIGNAKADIIAAIADKGIVVTDGEKLDALAEKIAQISQGVELPELTNPGTAADLAEGMELIDQNGEKVTGSLPEGKPTVKSNALAKVAIYGTTYIQSKVIAGSDAIVRTGTELITAHPASDFGDAAASDVVAGKTFTSAAGLQVTGTHACGEVPVVEQATPTITVDANGLITASATQEEGKVAAGTKSATQQLTIQETQTIIPGTADQTISSGKYLIGEQTIKGDTNLVAGNIKKGVSIFGVTGSYAAEESGGYSSGDIVKAQETSNLTVGSGYSGITVNYGTEVTNTDGVLSLSGTTGSVKVSSVDDLDVIKGKYVRPSSSYGTTTGIYYIPEDATITQGGSTYSKTYTADKANQMFVLA